MTDSLGIERNRGEGILSRVREGDQSMKTCHMNRPSLILSRSMRRGIDESPEAEAVCRIKSD
jgi:hypothetical protein